MERNCNSDIEIRMAIGMMAALDPVQDEALLFKYSGKLLGRQIGNSGIC